MSHVCVCVCVCVSPQDIAVDGWALTLLPPSHVAWAATCQTLGTSTGFFTSFTVFLALQVWSHTHTHTHTHTHGHTRALTACWEKTAGLSTGKGTSCKDVSVCVCVLQDADFCNRYIRSWPLLQRHLGIAAESQIPLLDLVTYLRYVCECVCVCVCACARAGLCASLACTQERGYGCLGSNHCTTRVADCC